MRNVSSGAAWSVPLLLCWATACASPEATGPHTPQFDKASGPSIVVTSLGDSDQGSLRQAIADAPAGATITFARDLCGAATSCDIVLASQLTISKDLTIQGPTAYSLTLRAGAERFTDEFRVLEVLPNATVALANLTITGGVRTVEQGQADGGGGILNSGTLTLTNTTVSGNRIESGFGGGIYNKGNLTLTRSVVTQNQNDIGFGAGIYNEGTLVLNKSAVASNHGPETLGGGIFNVASLELTKSIVSGNDAVLHGGISNHGTLLLSNSIVSGNSGFDNAGGIYNNGAAALTNSSVNGNWTQFLGGGIENDGTLTLTNSTVSGNQSESFTAGIYNGADGSLVLTNSTVTRNTGGDEHLGNVGSGVATIGAVELRGKSCINDNQIKDTGFVNDPASPVNIFTYDGGTLRGRNCRL